MISLRLLPATTSSHTDCKHGLNKILNIAEDNTITLNWIDIARFGIHGLDLHALEDGVDFTACGLENAPDYYC